MIANDRQYRISRAQIKKLQAAVRGFDVKAVAKKAPSRVLAEAELAAVKSELESLAAQVGEYEALASGDVTLLKAPSLQELPVLLIKARIAKGLSQRQLAEKMGLREQQIQRYESESYGSASLRRLVQVADALGLSISEVGELRHTRGRTGMAKQRRTGRKAAKAASRVLRDGRTGKDSKRAAGSALSQAAPKRAGKKR